MTGLINPLFKHVSWSDRWNKPVFAMTGFINLFSARQVKKPVLALTGLKKTDLILTGFLNPSIWGRVFSSPEPKAQVSYCHSALSVVRPSVVRPSVRPSVVRPSVNFHIFNFFSRTAWWILMKLGRDEVLMVPYKCCCFSARSAQGQIQGGAKIGQRGSPSSRNFFFRPESYSDKPNG